jgi:hypothetical protein
VLLAGMPEADGPNLRPAIMPNVRLIDKVDVNNTIKMWVRNLH